jgi:hypothetical protein
VRKTKCSIVLIASRWSWVRVCPASADAESIMWQKRP